jgi:tetratricopeptide (TPR) repeat protein
MSNMQHQLAKLAVTIFSANVDAAGGVAQAARQILHIYDAISDLGTLCKDLDDRRDNSALETATTKLESLLRRVGPLGYVISGEQSLELNDIYQRISWKRVQLLSHELRFCAASLRIKYATLWQIGRHLKRKRSCTDLSWYRNRERGSRVDTRDADTLAKSGEAISPLKHELHQLEQQAAKQSALTALPTANPTDSPEILPTESICAQCDVLQQEVDSANARLELYRTEEASDLVEAGRYEEAATIYERLYKVRELEIDRKWKIGDNGGADNAEKEALKIKYEVAVMLKKQGKLPEAEVAMQNVWQRRRKLLPKNHKETNSAQLQLCRILRDQRSRSKYKTAQKLYNDVWSDQDWTSKLGAEDAWIMNNGHELGIVLIEQGSFSYAEEQLRNVLDARKFALEDGNPATVETAAQLAVLVAQRGEAKEAAAILIPYLGLPAAEFSHQALECTATLGELVFQYGEYADAEQICRIVWDDARIKPGARSPGAISAGWHLSLALYFRHQEAKYEEAKAILNALLQTRPGEYVDLERTLQVKCLLSWVCRKAEEFEKADEFARSVWEQKKNENILGPLFSSTGVNRIWLLSRYRKDDHDRNVLSKEVCEVWNDVLTTTKALTLSRNQAKSVAQDWRNLAEELDRFAKKRRHSSVRAAEMRKEADKLEKRWK